MGFQQGLSGLNAAAKNLDVIGNNVSNSNTVGFKLSQAQFADVYANSITGGGGITAGIGVKVATVAQQFSQGNISTTSNSMDMAISGNGFFRMSNNGAISYSRNGQFQVDKNGFIVNSQGFRLTGTMMVNNVMGVTPTDIQIPTGDLVPKQTATVLAGLNLDSRLATVPSTTAFNPATPATYNNSTSMTVYDSQGATHVASLYFAKTAANNWDTYMTIDGNVTPPAATSTAIAGSTVTVPSTTGLVVGMPVTGGGVPTGTTITAVTATSFTTSSAPTAASPQTFNFPLTQMVFNSDGTLFSPSTAVTSASFKPTPAAISQAGSALAAAAAGAASTVTVNSTTGMAVGAMVTGGGLPAGTTIASIVDATHFTTSVLAAAYTGSASSTLTITNPPSAANQTISFNFTGTSQFGGIFGVNSLTQDGYASGRMTGFSTGADGMVSGRYSNGQTKTLGQVVLSGFTNPQGLQPLGNNNWAETSTSGTPLTGVPGSASLGVLQSSAVEDSNVDLTAELVNMITAQRVYQANAQTVKTQDQVLQTLVNLR